MKSISGFIHWGVIGRFTCLSVCVFAALSVATAQRLAPESDVVLATPSITSGEPAPGKRVAVTPPEYAGTQVFHTLYLPSHWKPDGPKLPIIFEYTGNYFPASGSTGEVEDAGLGFGLSGGNYIWVSLPYINSSGDDNQVTWWGDEKATIDYAKQNVPRMISQYNADPNAVFLCGFSRGAIGVNYLGLHDEEISKLWDALITHDHFDGVKRWGTSWGSPLEKYRAEATVRLKRVGDRPYLISQNGGGSATMDYVKSVLVDADNFRLNEVNTKEIFGGFPNEFAKHPHTDRWLVQPSRYRTATWSWMNEVVRRRRSARDLGPLIFADEFERTESQEIKDEPGNEWTTSSDKTAGGNKQVDLRGGAMHIVTHESANHATSVRHAFSFQNGTIALRLKLHNEKDSIKLNFTDLGCKSVHAGHLFDVVASPSGLVIEDRKTGAMNLEIRKGRAAGTLTAEQKRMLKRKRKSFSMESIKVGQWHELFAHVDGDTVSVELDQSLVAEFQSEGFAHRTKTLIRFLVPHSATVDDVRIWRRDP